MADFDLFSILGLSAAIIAVIIAYIDMRRRLKQQQEFSQLMANLINTLREELKLFRQQSMTSEDVKRQKILDQTAQQQWNRMKDIGRAIGWFLEYMEDTEE